MDRVVTLEGFKLTVENDLVRVEGEKHRIEVKQVLLLRLPLSLMIDAMVKGERDGELTKSRRQSQGEQATSNKESRSRRTSSRIP